MLGRFLRGLALWIGVYVLLTAVHFGLLWGLDRLRMQLETRFEDRYGTEVVDREPPYSRAEWLVVALDVQPSMYWVESLGMSALMSLPVALFVGAGALAFRRRLWGRLVVLSVIASILTFYLLYLLNEQVFAGYLLQQRLPVFTVGGFVGLVQGLVASLVFGAPRGRSEEA